MTIRLSHAQARALSKLDKSEPLSPDEIGETRATCDALVTAGYARRSDPYSFGRVAYVKTKELV